ncbi:MAG: heavy metal translocating P-type ATPase [Longimicrobiales bacterium]|nr:heavy metal translocating P-type ATPase [Longimicrobiales bacterium]
MIPTPVTLRDSALRLAALSVLLTLLGIAVGAFSDGAVATAGWTLAYLAGGWAGARAAAAEIVRLRVDIDLLMILAALGALVIEAPLEGATLLFLFSLSNLLQGVATERSRDAIRSLMELRPEVATVRRDGEVTTVPLGEVRPGEIYLVGPGDRIPLDGEVITGESEVDQASLTGESAPLPRGPGDAVLAGTMNGGGALDVRTTRRAEDSALARMIALVEEAQAEKAETQQIIDRWEQPYALGVIALAVLAVIVPVGLFGTPFDPVFYRAMTLLVAASPCALVISTPAALLSAIATGARHGVLFKGGVFIEKFATVRAIAFDKTGTLTTGSTGLATIVTLDDGVDEVLLLALAAAVQERSEHHLASATLRAAEARGCPAREATDFRAVPGRGVEARVDGERVRIGNPAHFADTPLEAGSAVLEAVDRLRARGETAVIVARNGDAIGVLGFVDEVRPEAAAMVRALRDQGVGDLVILTGDHADVANAVADAVGISEVRAEVLPDAKVAEVRRLRDAYGVVAMVGDGVNDAAALTTADVGIAMGDAGTDIALESADLVLISDDLSRIPWALDLSRRARRTLIQNLSFSLAMIVAMVVTILTIGLPLPLAVLGHEGSTVLVALNGLRLLRAPDVSTPPTPAPSVVSPKPGRYRGTRGAGLMRRNDAAPE